jgi:hypothetical protein
MERSRAVMEILFAIVGPQCSKLDSETLLHRSGGQTRDQTRICSPRRALCVVELESFRGKCVAGSSDISW